MVTMPGTYGSHIAPVPVPFKSDFTIDEEGLKRQIDYLLSIKGIRALCFNAHTGEVDSLSREERLNVLKIGVKHARGRAKVVGGVVPIPDSTQGAIDLAKDVKDAGADGILLIAPRWFTWGINEWPEIAQEYVRAVASAVHVPIIFYNLGPNTGINYSPQTLTTVCSIDGVVGIKDVSWETHRFEMVVEALRGLNKPGFSIYTGNDTLMLHDFLHGADGVLVIVHNIFGEVITEMYDAVQEGDYKKAWKLDQQTAPITRAIFSPYSPPFMKVIPRCKEIMVMLGLFETAVVKPPLMRITAEERKELRKALEKSKLEVKVAA